MFVKDLIALVKRQGTTKYVSMALEELGLTKVQQVTNQVHFVRRVVALQEEDK